MIRSSENISPWVRGWLAWSAFCALATEVLSIPGWLNAWGWGAAVAAFVGFMTQSGWMTWVTPRLRWRRYRRGLPALFGLLAGIVALGACVYTPTNIDTLWYRLPRVIQWLQAGRWHWLDTERWRLNSIAFGLELQFLPLAAWGLPDRLLALPNFISFLLLPGLVFRVFRQLSVPSGVARSAMWIVASGWCFVSQAGSTASDAFSAVYFLAALDTALSFRRSLQPVALGWSVIAAALLTNTKQTNLPLLLPWVVALWPSRIALGEWVRRAPVRSVGVLAIAFLISTGPLIFANWIHTGSWSGTPAWANERWRPAHPWFALGIQLPFLLLQNLQLPITPGVDTWNSLAERWVSGPMAPWFQGFDLPGRLLTQIGEHSAGLGCAPLLWALATIWAGRSAQTKSPAPRPNRMGLWLAGATWFGVAVVLSRIAFQELARYFAAYYPLLLLPALMGSGVARLSHRRWWNRAGVAVLGTSIVFAATLRHRPLACPPELLESPHLSRLGSIHRLGAALRFQTEFGRQLDRLVQRIPPGEAVGWAHDSPGEAEFGWPPRSRTIRLLPPNVTPEVLAQAGLRWVVTSAMTDPDPDAALNRWAAERGGIVQSTVPFIFRFGYPGTPYALVEFPTTNPP